MGNIWTLANKLGLPKTDILCFEQYVTNASPAKANKVPDLGVIDVGFDPIPILHLYAILPLMLQPNNPVPHLLPRSNPFAPNLPLVLLVVW